MLGRILTTVVALVFVAASEMSQAAPVAYAFSGVLTDIRGSGAGQVFGTAFHGTYVHDDTAQTGSLIEPGRQLYAGGQFGVAAGSLALTGTSTSELQVFNDWSSAIGGYNQDDGYFVSSYVYDPNGIDFFLIQFDMWDFAGAVLTSLDMPSQAQFGALAAHGRVWIRRFEGGTETGLAQGGFSAMVQELPEPGSLLLALCALALVPYTTRRR
jgi:hypothetical protein